MSSLRWMLLLGCVRSLLTLCDGYWPTWQPAAERARCQASHSPAPGPGCRVGPSLKVLPLTAEVHSLALPPGSPTSLTNLACANPEGLLRSHLGLARSAAQTQTLLVLSLGPFSLAPTLSVHFEPQLCYPSCVA